MKTALLIPLDVLKELDEMYPSRPPNPNDSDREIWMKAGERRLVDVLWAKFNEATENIHNHVQLLTT